jgi:phosphatidate cytidylyltransferase
MLLASLRTRTISAAIMLPVVLAAIIIGGDLFAILVALVLGVATFEFAQLMKQGGFRPALFFCWGFALTGVLVARFPDEAWLRPAITGLLGAALVWQLFQQDRTAPTADWALTIAGGLYIGWMGGHLIALRNVPEGLQWLLMALLITWFADSGAYIFGSNWGRHKLAPWLSPGKTIEGTVAGWLTGILTGGVVAALLGQGVAHGLLLGVLIGVASPLGDLGISMMKRQVGAKDTSRLIPGHGGVLDRIDSVLVTVTVAFYYTSWVIL